MVRLRSLSSFTAFICLIAAGCGGEKLPPLGKVTGTITLDGEPLPNAMVTFIPKVDRQSVGMTDASGVYTLLYNAKNKGALVGTHKVTVITQINAVDTPTEVVPPQYNTKTELTAEVSEGDNIIDFDLTAKK